MSRTGKRTELLRGATSYGIVHILAAIMFWRDSPANGSLIMILCAGEYFVFSMRRGCIFDLKMICCYRVLELIFRSLAITVSSTGERTLAL